MRVVAMFNVQHEVICGFRGRKSLLWGSRENLESGVSERNLMTKSYSRFFVSVDLYEMAMCVQN